MTGDGLAAMRNIWVLNQAEEKANSVGAGLVLIGILPTITPDDAVLENVFVKCRYGYLNQEIVRRPAASWVSTSGAAAAPD